MSGSEHTLTVEMLAGLDALSADHEVITPIMQHHRLWGVLVDELRAIQRLVEAGVAVKIEGTPTVLTTWQEFYAWAHGRYHLLEDAFDRWIGDDSTYNTRSAGAAGGAGHWTDGKGNSKPPADRSVACLKSGGRSIARAQPHRLRYLTSQRSG